MKRKRQSHFGSSAQFGSSSKFSSSQVPPAQALTCHGDTNKEKRYIVTIAGLKRSNEASSGLSPPPKGSRVGESPTQVDIDEGEVNFLGKSSSDQPEGPVTLSTITSLLQEELADVSGSVSQLRLDLSAFKKETGSELASMGLHVKSVEDSHAEMRSQFAQLQKNFESFKIETPRVMETSHPENMTILAGNLPNTDSVEEAPEFIRKLCVFSGIPQPVDIFPKGEYKGILWAKCGTLSQRDVLIAKIRNSKGPPENRPWAKIDLPIDKRTAENVLFAFKHMWCDWEYRKQSVKVDTDTCTLKVLGKEILKAKVTDFTLQLQWCDGDWEPWEEFQSASEFYALQKKAQENLDRATSFASIGGKGKGKHDSHYG